MRARSFLYRISAVVATFALLLSPLGAAPRRRGSGPRAIAVVRWQPDEKGHAHPVLIPVAIEIENKWYDAGLYGATPRPMALEPGTLYEAQDKGELLGFYTVENANVAQNSPERRWVGTGSWKSDSPQMERDPAHPQATLLPRGYEQQVDRTDPDSDPKKPATTVYDESGKPIENPKEEEPKRDKEGRPEPISRLPQIAKPDPKSKTGSETASPDDDPDRPRIRRGMGAGSGSGTSASSPTGVAAPPLDEDPNRPRIRRGKPSQSGSPGNSAETTAPVLPERVRERGLATGQGRVYEAVAVSDADTSGLPQSYRFRASEDEQQELREKMLQLAEAELARSGPRPAPPAGKTTSRGKAPGKAGAIRAPQAKVRTTLKDIRFDLFDLDYNNSAELVLSVAEERPGQPDAYLTVIARTDVQNNLHQLFATVTAADRLDAQPRLVLVDAVDADGDGPAELLFREDYGKSAAYILYKVGPDALEALVKGIPAD